MSVKNNDWEDILLDRIKVKHAKSFWASMMIRFFLINKIRKFNKKYKGENK